MSDAPQRVAVVGASDNPERYAHRAIVMLREHGHTVLPVTPRDIHLPNLEVYPTLTRVPKPIDTVTLYVNPKVVESMADEIVAARPDRVIFNPGTEHSDVARRLQAAGIATVNACTLVLLSTGQFS